LFAGIITSSFDVMLSVFAIPMTGIPALVASITACSSTDEQPIVPAKKQPPAMGSNLFLL